AGSVDAVKMSFEMSRFGGHVILEGVAGDGQLLTLQSAYMLLRDLTVHGVFSYTTQAWSKVLDLLHAGLVDFESLVTHRFPLEQYKEAFEQMKVRSGKVGKTVLLHRSDAS